MRDNLKLAKDIVCIWEPSSYQLQSDKEQHFNIASTYALLDIAQSLRDISSGIHSIDSKIS